MFTNEYFAELGLFFSFFLFLLIAVNIISERSDRILQVNVLKGKFRKNEKYGNEREKEKRKI